MGLSGMILKKRELFNFEKIVNSIKEASKRANIVCLDGLEFEKKNDGTYEYITIVLQGKTIESDLEFLIYVYNDVDENSADMFHFISGVDSYHQCINIENFISCSMLMKFIYEYLKLNVEDIFYNELGWNYTLEDMEEIALKEEYDPEWAYKNPNDLE